MDGSIVSVIHTFDFEDVAADAVDAAAAVKPDFEHNSRLRDLSVTKHSVIFPE